MPLSQRLNLDWAVEGMFAPGDPVVAAYRKLQTRFGGKDICLAVYQDPQLWDESGAGLERLEVVTQRLEKVAGVSAVLSLSELHRVLEKIRGPMSLLGLRDDRSPILDPKDKLAQAMASVFEGYTHRRDSEYVAVACMLTSDPNQTVRGPSNHEATLDALRSAMQELPTPARNGMVTGEPVLVAEGFKMVERDGVRLGMTSSVLVSIVLLLCFRSLRWTLIPLIVVHWSLLLTRALLVLLNLNLTMISSTLTAIVTVIGVATSMHLLLKYQQQRRKGNTREAALQFAFTTLLVPIFWACVTDAVGFSSLLIARVGPVRDFGLMMAIGSISVFVSIVVLVPGLALVGSFDTDPRTPKLDAWVRYALRRVLRGCLRFRYTAMIALGGVLLLGIVGSTRMQVETDFTKNFHPSSPIVKGYEVIERELGGAGVWDIMLAAPPQLSSEYVDQVAKLETRLRELRVSGDHGEIGLTKVLSLIDALQAADSSRLLSALPATTRLQGMKAAMPDMLDALVTTDSDLHGVRWLRVMLRSREQVSAAEKSQLIESVSNLVQEFTQEPEWSSLFDRPPPKSEVAGYHVMLSRLVASALADQWRCFFLATVAIYITMVMATRSLWLGLITLLPNVLPIAIVLGWLGWTGARANMGVAMIAAVSLGLSIDSSIHYLLHFQRQRSQGKTRAKAILSAQENVGLAVVLATVALVAGFLSLSGSEFVPTVVFGNLTSLTMLGSLLGNLVLLPLLLATFGSSDRTRIDAAVSDHRSEKQGSGSDL